jgi:acetyl esterase/lipase
MKLCKLYDAQSMNRTLMKYWLIAVSSFLLQACTTLGEKVINLPSKLFGEYSVSRDIAFGTHHQTLDVYRPSREQPSAGVIVFLYGGGWKSGSKDYYDFIGDAFTARGYVVVIPDYRKYPEVKHPSFVEDAAQAVRWVTEHIETYGGDKTRLFVVGHSAGAHIGAMLIADTHFLQDAGVDASHIKAFAGLAGPYNFIPEEEPYLTIFGPPDRYPTMQVNHFITGDEAPMFLLHGEEDKTVGLFNLEKLKSAIHSHSGKVEWKLYKDTGHIGIVAALSRPLRSNAPVLEDMDRFFKTISAEKTN